MKTTNYMLHFNDITIVANLLELHKFDSTTVFILHNNSQWIRFNQK